MGMHKKINKIKYNSKIELIKTENLDTYYKFTTVNLEIKNPRTLYPSKLIQQR